MDTEKSQRVNLTNKFHIKYLSIVIVSHTATTVYKNVASFAKQIWMHHIVHILHLCPYKRSVDDRNWESAVNVKEPEYQ
ncbi:hypothetical protein T07_2035 [Trichinella nelsoni]|uniref:Uncharacterized protein n=1 Tax=Trichinella nelsoni TaxID=6336 RepID=A0A0V0RVE4_9BILA|nr:hypothetical protein T07_2035 [Trichinella nelsoni]